MVSIDKVQRGVSRFIDSELMPKLSGKDKWIIAGLATMYIAKLPQLAGMLNSKTAVKVLGIIGPNSEIDIDAIINSFRPAANGEPITISIPMVGDLALNSQDIEKLRTYIVQA